MTDTSDTAIARMIHAAPFADNTAGIPEMVAMLLALQAERKAGWVARVKPLEWDAGKKYGDAQSWLSHNKEGRFCYGVDLAGIFYAQTPDGESEGYATLELAKAAAQADYAARVLAALTPDTEAKP